MENNIKFCVGSVEAFHVEGAEQYGNFSIWFKAYTPDAYGEHFVDSWDDESVTWYDTEQEALKNRINAEEFVISRKF